jgi:hypothetical protein
VVRWRLGSAQLEKKVFHGAGLGSRTSAQACQRDRELRRTKLERIALILAVIIGYML